MTALETPTVARDLQRRMRGAVIEPGGAGWEDATRAFNLAFTQEPTLVAVPEDEHDVVAVVGFAREHGLQVAPQRTGHNAEPLGDMEDTILLKTDRLRGVDFDVERRVARVRAGSKWAEVVPRPPSSASRPSTGRRRTSASPATRSAAGSAVGPQARPLDEQRHRDRARHRGRPAAARRPRARPGALLGAPRRRRQLRRRHGARGPALRDPGDLRRRPLLPVERSSEVLHAWLDWTRTVPDEVTSVGRILQSRRSRSCRTSSAARTSSWSRPSSWERERGRGAARAAPRARPGDRHVRDGAAGRALRAPHGSARARAVHGRGDDARRARRSRDRRVRRGRGA